MSLSLQKPKIQTALIVATFFLAANAGAVTLSPIRCAGDNLEQWAGDTANNKNAPIAGTARGRNAWWLVCSPNKYKDYNDNYDFLGIDAEFDPSANHGNGTLTRWYPTFGVKQAPAPGSKEVPFTRPNNWVAPTTPPSSIGDAACQLPDKFVHVGMCASGCVTPDQEVATLEGETSIESLEFRAHPSVLVPDLNASTSAAVSVPVESFIKDGTPSFQKIVVISMSSGRELRASMNHPFLTQDFTMRRADLLTEADSLVKADGTTEKIKRIEIQNYVGRLHNLTIANTSLKKSLYVVQGYISGDKKVQDESLSDKNRQILRSLIK